MAATTVLAMSGISMAHDRINAHPLVNTNLSLCHHFLGLGPLGNLRRAVIVVGPAIRRVMLCP